MKKRNLQIPLMFLTVMLMAGACVLLFGCSGNYDTETKKPAFTIGTRPNVTTSPAHTSTPEDTSAPESTALPEETTLPPDTTAPEQTTAPAETTAPLIKGDYINPLTGIPTNDNLSLSRPVAVVIDNGRQSLAKQTGLLAADIVYEGLVTHNGISRFMAVYSDYTKTGTVCNVRSGREYNISWAMNHNAVLICHGGAKNDTYDFFELAVRYYGSRWGFIDTQQESVYSSVGNSYGTVIDSGGRTDLKYDTLSTPEAIAAVLNSKTSKFVSEGRGSIIGTPRRSLEFVTYGTYPVMEGSTAATDVRLSFTCNNSVGSKNVFYKYDALTRKYLRFQDNIAHTDAATGKQLSFTNVIVLSASVDSVATNIENDPYTIRIATEGEGIGFWFYGGKCVQISWEKSGVDGSLRLFDSGNRPLKLACGNTYIGYLNSSYIISTGYDFWS